VHDGVPGGIPETALSSNRANRPIPALFLLLCASPRNSLGQVASPTVAAGYHFLSFGRSLFGPVLVVVPGPCHAVPLAGTTFCWLLHEA
jgi:hypothetical protein